MTAPPGKPPPEPAVAPPPMLRRSLPFLLVAAVLAIAWLVVETFRLAELAGLAEVELRSAVAERDAARAALAEQAASRAAASAEAARLATELATASTQLQGMSEVLAKVRSDSELARAAAEEAERRRAEPMSDGVRACLAAMHECLRAEGFASHRFVRARSVDADGLHDVEMYLLDDDQLGVTFVVAARMTAELDRARSRLVLKFLDGHRLVGSVRQQLAAEGFAIAFEPVDGRMFEQRLPYLVRAVGAYPEPAARGQASDVDPTTRRQWLERLDELLAAAGTAQALRVNRFRGMAGGYFLQVELIGTDERRRVLSGAHCARLAVEDHKTANVVSLLLLDGVLRNGGIESTISADGYRILLPKLDCKRATDLMFGMVVTK